MKRAEVTTAHEAGHGPCSRSCQAGVSAETSAGPFGVARRAQVLRNPGEEHLTNLEKITGGSLEEATPDFLRSE